jgi:DNA-binding response OmpR family regulator
MRILVVEDDAALRDVLAQALRQAQYSVDTVSKGDSGDHALAAGAYDLVILDLGLPGMDGFEVLRRLRARRDRTPVLVLSAWDEVENRVKGLDLGADDYLTKPFVLTELEARVRALLRRASGADTVMTNGPLQLDSRTRQFMLNGEALDLSARETTVLEVLMQRIGRVVVKARLTQQLSAWDAEIGTNAIEVYIHRLRKKIEPKGIRIRTIHGLGYMLERHPGN